MKIVKKVLWWCMVCRATIDGLETDAPLYCEGTPDDRHQIVRMKAT